MSGVVIVGAGREGKGFLGEVFCNAGWQVTFIDNDSAVIDAMNSAQAYEVKLFTTKGVITRPVSGYRAFVADKEYGCADDVVAADVLAICLYPEDIAEAAGYLASCLERRYRENPDSELTMLLCTNANHLVRQVEEAFRSGMNSDESRTWFDRRVHVRDTIVRRSVGADSSSSLQLEAQAYLSLMIQAPIPVDLHGVEWMEVTDNIAKLKEIKLYTYNGPHAAIAYAGHRLGFTTIGDAMRERRVSDLSERVREEAVQAAASKFDMNPSDVREFSRLPTLEEDIVDFISRVAYDPIRKLAYDGRLVGVARQCMAQGIYPEATIEAIAHALSYDHPSDPSATKLQRLVSAKGVGAAVNEVCGLDRNCRLFTYITEEYERHRH